MLLVSCVTCTYVRTYTRTYVRTYIYICMYVYMCETIYIIYIYRCRPFHVCAHYWLYFVRLIRFAAPSLPCVMTLYESNTQYPTLSCVTIHAFHLKRHLSSHLPFVGQRYNYYSLHGSLCPHPLWSFCCRQLVLLVMYVMVRAKDTWIWTRLV